MFMTLVIIHYLLVALFIVIPSVFLTLAVTPIFSHVFSFSGPDQDFAQAQALKDGIDYYQVRFQPHFSVVNVVKHFERKISYLAVSTRDNLI